MVHLLHHTPGDQAIKRVVSRNKWPKAKGFSLIELLIVVAIISIIASIAIPNLLQSKAAANEASAINSVRNIVTAQIAYSVTVGSGNYAGDLDKLEDEGLIDNELGSGTKEGYTFSVEGGSTFNVNARPINYGSTGTRSFYADETGVIRYTTTDAPATSASPALGQ
ncbi:prepilin-type N-terminal cleavage/methylation domain-containing protein [Acidobacteria bacterium AH-259-D05]|nr:prepilin-type N-terminal cleavage/methylation domain-containing protein [Acidobacteria bacterium AH-259-D05]